MKPDSELTMTIDTTFNSILNEIQLSKLNFMINVTPYAAYITLKKSTLVDKEGFQSLPSPPVLRILEQTVREKFDVEAEISCLKSALSNSEDKCYNLENENTHLKESLQICKDECERLTKQNEMKGKEVYKLKCEKKDLESALSTLKKEYNQFSCDSRKEINAFQKTIKTKDKEIYNLNSKFSNSQESNSNLKIEMSSLRTGKSKVENKVKTLEQKIRKMELKKQQQQLVSTQTYPTIDVPYSVTDPLPPIFASKLCLRTRPVFLSKSLPDLIQLSWVSVTEEDILREQADEALDILYDREIASYYEEVYKEACDRKGKDVAVNLGFG